MADYQFKNKAQRQYDKNKARIRLEGKLTLDDVLNVALDEMTQQFKAAEHQGRILEIGGSEEEMTQLLLDAHMKKLERGKPEDDSA